MDDSEFLDDGFESETLDKPKPFNYVKYALTYIFLMMTIGALLTKVMTHFAQDYITYIAGAFAYIVFAFVLALIQEIIQYFYRKLMEKSLSKKPKHPLWFRLLESSFYIWCVIVLVTFVGSIV